ncbi:type VII secretion protein EccE [Gordonia oryzae]|uniref:type VII secretion protein EccE n=1 Tax=Gordonia oryzae TaxID=2487349 RepID=UPI001FEBD69F|nr:type VII secretion protein EccE [Gordonia oryzae]
MTTSSTTASVVQAGPHSQIAHSDSRLRSSSQSAMRRIAPTWCVLVVELIALVALVVIATTGIPWWIAALVVVLTAVWFIPVSGHPMAQRVRERASFRMSHDRRRRRAQAVSDPFDITTSDGSQFGMRWDGDALVSMLEIAESPEALTILEPGATVDAVCIPVRVLAESLRQFDITLAAIDIHINGSRSRGNSPVAAVYDEVLGPLPAIAHRSVWLTVRLDPTLCPEAVARRGGGSTGILKTTVTGTRRVANRLREDGFDVRSLTAAEITRSITHLSDGIAPETVEETWENCRSGQIYLRSYGLEQPILTSAGLDRLWTVPTHTTTLALSLRTTEDDLIEATGLVRFDTITQPTRIDLDGLSPLGGHQYDALIGSLPLPRPRSVGVRPTYGSPADFDELRLPASGCGQLIGADPRGRAVALPMFGPTIDRVEIAGSLHLVQQVVLRAIALGARVLVSSGRPAHWQQMVAAVGDNHLLWVAEFDRGAMHAGAEANYSVIVFDGIRTRPVNTGVTSLVVHPIGTPLSDSADVTLAQLYRESDTVRVTTRSGAVVVEMVASDNEMAYVGASYDLD